MAATFTSSDAAHIAKLATLPIGEKLLKTISDQLSQVIDLVNKLQKVDTSNVPPTSQVTGLTNVFREDTVTPSMTQEEALSNAPRSHDGFFVVNAIFEEE